jgi:hypothetical protein
MSMCPYEHLPDRICNKCGEYETPPPKTLTVEEIVMLMSPKFWNESEYGYALRQAKAIHAAMVRKGERK